MLSLLLAFSLGQDPFSVRGSLRPDGDGVRLVYPLTGVMAKAHLVSPPLLFRSRLDMTLAARIANPTGPAVLKVQELRSRDREVWWFVVEVHRP